MRGHSWLATVRFLHWLTNRFLTFSGYAGVTGNPLNNLIYECRRRCCCWELSGWAMGFPSKNLWIRSKGGSDFRRIEKVGGSREIFQYFKFEIPWNLSNILFHFPKSFFFFFSFLLIFLTNNIRAHFVNLQRYNLITAYLSENLF